MNFRAITAGGGSGPATAAAGTPTTGPTPPPGAIAASWAGFSTMPFALKFAGDYGHLSTLFTELERFVAVKDGRIDVKGRLMRIDSITLAPTPGNLKTGLQADVNASTFVVPRPRARAAPRRAPSGRHHHRFHPDHRRRDWSSRMSFLTDIWRQLKGRRAVAGGGPAGRRDRGGAAGAGQGSGADGGGRAGAGQRGDGGSTTSRSRS